MHRLLRFIVASVRRASVAGTWYPNDAARLVSHLDGYLDSAGLDIPEVPVRAIVAPHAGLMYSGPVAGYAYRAIRRQRPSALVVIGPSHFVPFPGVSIWPAGAWETPLGAVRVQQDLADALIAASQRIVELPAAHSREHSLGSR